MHNASNNQVPIDSNVYQFINQQILPLVHYSKHDFWRDFNIQYANYKNKIVPISTQFLAMKIVQGSWFRYPFESKSSEKNKENLCHFLDNNFPLFFGSHKNVKQYKIVDSQIVAMLDSWTHSSLKDCNQCAAFGKNKVRPEYILLRHQDMHIMLTFDINNEDDSLTLRHRDTFIRTEQSMILNFDMDKSSIESDDNLDSYKKIKAILSKETNDYLLDKIEDKTLFTPDGKLFELPIKQLSLVIKNDQPT